MTVRELKRLPLKSLFILDPDSGSNIDLNAIAAFHDILKFDTKFQQRMGRISRNIKNTGDEPDDA